jgi:hypothetical protein
VTPAAYNAQRVTPLVLASLPATWRATWARGPDAFAAAVVAFQRSSGLAPDGKCGPLTLAAILATPTARIFGTIGVYTAQHKRRRAAPPTSIVLHDTVGHTARGAQDTLDQKGYATHFFVDLDGAVYQCMDPATEYGAHCQGNNERSIGVDVVAILDPKHATDAQRRRVVDRDWSAAGGRWRGKVVDYTPEQRGIVVLLVTALCDTFGIPHFVIDSMTGYGQKVPGLTPAFRGVLAHAQWSTQRWDGLLAVEALVASGRYEHDGGVT